MMNLPVEYSKTPWQQRRAIREQYIELQEGKCYWCEEELTIEPLKEMEKYVINWRLFPDNFLAHPIHLQHNHDTDMTEGAVHAFCNAVMWQYYGR